MNLGNQTLLGGFEFKLSYVSLKVEKTFLKGTCIFKVLAKQKFVRINKVDIV